ncbi:MAG: saccharopine dehydrogenase C-terminal domain-containing protein [Bacteroidales bacterium]|nr:saccharopine dehydrogenase C-terminal domain-containing protein [Bacteroidales bacterium]
MSNSKKSVLVLGAGLIGKPMAFDLIKNNAYLVGVADISETALKPFENTGIQGFCFDLKTKSELQKLVKQFDFVINAVPGFMGFETLKSVIECKQDVVDIALYPEDPFELNKLAQENGVCVICDMGVAPGMSHLLSGFAAHQLEEVESLLIYVGGLPQKRSYPWEYKAVFSPSDVIEEYTRPARLIENGKIVFKEALSEAELLEFDPVGTLEAFNSDGLRSLVYTIKANYMAEKTLRYQGHIGLIKALKSSGFFDEKPLEMNGSEISPLEFTKKVLFSKWKLEQGEEDLTVMRIIVKGKTQEGKSKQFQWDLFDKYDNQTSVHSMARTTGYAATAALRLIESGTYGEHGINVPEFVGKDEKSVAFILEQLEERGIHFNMTVVEA